MTTVTYNRDTSKDTVFYKKTLYAWVENDEEAPAEIVWYTLSENPNSGDIIYDLSGKQTTSYVGQIFSDEGVIEIMNEYDLYQAKRDPKQDIISGLATLYTDSTTLTTGMTLYDDTGTDTGYKVGTISGDSFDIQTSVSVNFVMGTGSFGITSYTIDDIKYTSDQTVSLSLGAHTLTAVPMDIPTSTSFTLYINETGVAIKSCSFIVSNSHIIFGNNLYVGTPADTFEIKASSGSN